MSDELKSIYTTGYTTGEEEFSDQVLHDVTLGYIPAEPKVARLAGYLLDSRQIIAQKDAEIERLKKALTSHLDNMTDMSPKEVKDYIEAML